MKSLFLGLLLTLSLLAAPLSEFDTKLDNFFIHFDIFLRHYQGCPLTSFDSTLCRPEKSYMDYKEYSAARSAAAKLFNLQEK